MKEARKKWEAMKDTGHEQYSDSTVVFVVLAIIGVFALVLLVATTAKAAEVNPNVTQDNIGATVCLSMYTKTIRPTSAYTQAWEKSVGGTKDTVVDHVIPLCAGGHPTDYKNYQLQKTATSYRKDTVEKHVCALLCSGRITLKEAQGLFYDE